MTHSIVIVTMNRPAELDTLLGSIFEQSRPPEQILVIDGGDESAYAATFPRLADSRITRIRMTAGLSAQRNRGLEEATGDILTFVDDDAVLGPEYCARIVEACEVDSGIVALSGINAAAAYPGMFECLLRRMLLVQTGCAAYRMRISGFPDSGPVHAAVTQEVQLLASTALSLRRTAIGGCRFEEYWLSAAPLGLATGRCFGEDMHFTWRLGSRGKLVILPSAVFFHVGSARNRESTFVTQALYVFAMRWISYQAATGLVGRAARRWALSGQFVINLLQTLRYTDTGYIRGYFKAVTTGMRGKPSRTR
jgi:glycosyltransferase involved in cell wall biosynthesis